MKARSHSPVSRRLLALFGLCAAAAGASLLVAPASQAAEADYIVLYKAGTNVGAEVRGEEARGNDVQDVFRSAVKGIVAPLDRADVARLRRDSDVLLVERDGPVRTVAAGPRDQSPATWGLDRVDQRALPLNNRITTDQNGFGVKAYIIDTGIRTDHVEFTGRTVMGFDAVGDGNGTNDCNGHGTHVAGTVGGSTYGVAPETTLVPVRVLNCAGSGTFSGVIAGIDWVTANHAAGEPAVANMSLGGGYSASINTAVTNASNDGVTMVVAAGNSNADACNYSPASAPSAVTVGSTTSADARSSFSNFGSCVDIVAPGSNIRTIGQAYWWAIVTTTTVGYGDEYPVTWQGRVVASVVMLVGVGLIGTVSASVAS
ncbi:MAG: S8 family serine peptidase, partial [Solirubrobacterales bacterium]